MKRAIIEWGIILICCVSLISCSGEKGKSKKRSQAENKLTQERETQFPREPVTVKLPTTKKNNNHPPQLIDLSFSPTPPVTGDHIKAIAKAFDPDNDRITILYQWSINGKIVQESEKPELKYPVKEGDKVGLTAVAWDGDLKSKPLSAMIIVGNAPPDVKVEDQQIVGSVYTARIVGKDPEREDLTFTIKKGPQGMHIVKKDKNQAIIEWKIGKKIQGEFPIEISIRDSQGAETLLTFKIKISRRSNASKK